MLMKKRKMRSKSKKKKSSCLVWQVQASPMKSKTQNRSNTTLICKLLKICTQNPREKQPCNFKIMSKRRILISTLMMKGLRMICRDRCSARKVPLSKLAQERKRETLISISNRSSRQFQDIHYDPEAKILVCHRSHLKIRIYTAKSRPWLPYRKKWLKSRIERNKCIIRKER